MNSENKKAELLLLSVAISWGASLPLTKLIINDIGIFTLLFFRFSIGGLITAAVFFRSLKKTNFKTLLGSFVLALLMSCVNILETWGLQFTTSTNAAFLSGLSLCIVPILSFFLYKNMPGKRFWIGSALALTGFYFLTAGEKGITSLNIGDMAVLLSAFVYAFYIVLIDRLIKREDSVVAGIYILIFSAILYMVLMLIPEPFPINFSGKLTTVVLITSIFCTAFAYCGHITAQKSITSIRAALILMAEPIFTTIFSLIIPDSTGATEALSFFKILGIIFMTAGMWAAEFGHLTKN